MRLNHTLTLLLIASTFVGGCGKENFNASAVNKTGTGGTGTGSGSGTPTVSPASPLTVQVQTIWDTDATQTTQTHQTCSVPAGIVPGSPGAFVNCNAYIPEGQLYFSSLLLTVSTDAASDCSIINFRPYFYQMSNTAGFLPFGATTPIDCSVSPTPLTCFNGPAVTIVPQFPTYKALYYLTAKALSNTYSIASANSFPKASNTWTTNYLSALSRTSDHAIAGDGYLANSMRDYVFSCRDKWDQIHSEITLTISDDAVLSGYNPPPVYVNSAVRSAWSAFP